MSEATFSKKEISIIGAGRVGTTFAAIISGLALPEMRITALISRSDRSLKRAEEIIGDRSHDILFSTKIGDLPISSNCVMIATPDDVIERTCLDVTRRLEKKTKGVLYIHFSGAKTLGVLKPALERGASAAAVHPIKSFANIKDSISTIKGTVYGVTYSSGCSRDIRDFVEYLIGKLEGRTIIVPDDKKSIYHASACVSSNYLVSLINYAVSINESIGISPEESLGGLIGLIEGTVANIKKLGSKKSLTGPIARGDVGTIKEHMDSFEKNLEPGKSTLYKVLGRETSLIAYENGWIDKNTLKKFLQIFST